MELDNYRLFLLHYLWKGYLSPVRKLINKEDLYDILDNYNFMGELYALPFLFPGTTKATTLACYKNDFLVAGIRVEEVFEIDQEEVCMKMFGTADINHPGVKYIYDMGNTFIAGEIVHYDSTAVESMDIPYIDPDTDKSYVFQSRNPPHKGHELIVKKYAPDCLYTTPFETSNSNDYPFEKKIQAYEIMKERYGVDLVVTLLPRLFAGPREALQNVLLFKNLGINKFIMGRGKNCYKNYHDEYEPIRFCKELLGDDAIIEQENIKTGGEMIRASDIKTKYVNNGLPIPENLMCPEVAKILYG